MAGNQSQASYWPLSKSKVVTIWLALDDADEYNSCLQIVPRSHLETQIPFAVSPAAENNVLTQRVDQPWRYGITAGPGLFPGTSPPSCSPCICPLTTSRFRGSGRI